ncbi:MAG: ATP-binding protein, partial [Bacteroidetes bacterium]|nr:ATP-binding protein [Bacteroidota bacterium]
MSRISRFNPYMMDDELILALNTGRENELAFIQEIIAHNVEGGGPPQHILLHGPRGIGKSFFLRLLQIRVRHDERIAFVLLPEEQLNVYQPGDLLQAIKNTLTGESYDAGISMWAREGVEAWRREWAALEDIREAQGHPHLVVGLENLDLLLKKGGAFEHSEDQFQLREFLSETPWLTLIATSLYPDLDIHYKDALFQFFAKYELRPWQEVQHEAYLRKRNRLEGWETTPISLAQLKALTRFTGGHPRITVIMADVLADNQVESAALTLDKTIDELTPFYQDLLNRIPPKSKKLFDALIRGGEPCSQSALAARVGTAQSVIAQSFNWLQTHGYLLAERPKGERQKLYSVRDRLFAHFYRMRYILQGSGRSILSVMSEFLTHFYDSQELKGQALEFYERGDEASSRELMHIALESTGIDPEALAWRDDIQALLEAIDLSDVDDIDIPDTQEEARDLLIRIRDLLAASTKTPSAINPEEFAHTLFGSVGLSFEEKIQTAKQCITGKILADNWIQLEQDLEAEAHQHQRWGGNIYISLRDHLANGDIFFEFLEDEALEHIRN